MAMVGEVVLKTRLDYEQFEKDLKKLDKVQINDKKIEITADLDSLRKTRTEIAKEIQKYEDKISELSSGVSKEKVMALPEFQEASAEIGKLKPQLEAIATAITSDEMKLQAINEYISQNPALQEKAKQKIEATTEAIKEETKAQEEFNKVIENESDVKQEIDDIKVKTDSVGKSFSSIGALIGGLSLVAFVGAIGLAGSKSENAKKQFEEIAMWIKHIGEDLLNLILPIAEAIVDMIYQVVKWFGKLLQDWFGIDIFSKRASDNMKKTVKNAKALRKQLLGFDEMNILNKDGTIGGLGTATTGGGTGGNNNKNTTKVAEGFIEDHMDEILTGTAALIGLKAGGLTGGTIASGIANFIEQLVDIGNIVDDPNAENIYELFKDSNPQVRFGDQLQEIFEKTGIMDKDNPLWITSLPALWKGIGKTFIQLITGELDGAEKVVKDGGQSINHATEQVINQINDTLDTNLRKPVFTDLLKKGVKTARETIEGAIVTYEDGLYTIKTKTGQTFTVTKEEFEMYKNTVFKGVKVFSSEAERTADDIQNKVIATASLTKDEVSKVETNTKGAVDVIKDNVLTTMNTFNDEGEKTAFNLKNNVETISSMTQKEVDAVNKKVKSSNTTIVKSVNDSINSLKDLGKTPVEKVGQGAVTAADSIREQIAKITGEDLPTDVEKGLTKVNKKLIEWAVPETAFSTNIQNIGKTAGTSVAKGLANGVNSALSKIESGMNSAVSSINQLMSKMGSSAVMGAYAIAGKVNQLAKVKLPRIQLAKGGIINRPGRGVAVGGERGAEWVQPLTDEQSLDRVANAIGKRIVLQPTIPIYVGNRLIARETRRINAQDEFAYNGGL